jgi:hypothetical protein
MRSYAIDLDEAFERVFADLIRQRLLLLSDLRFPSVVGLVVGEPVRGSWWAHPLCHEIYMVSQRLNHHADAIQLKLVSAKLTYIHRSVWPVLYAIASAREPWQLDGLSAGAKALLARAAKNGTVRMDEINNARSRKELGADARELESRLLVFGDDVHTESGAHVKRIETWAHWAARVKFDARNAPAPSDARAELERLVAGLNAESGASAWLPWQKKSAPCQARASAISRAS